MKYWSRAAADMLCGYCASELAPDSPIHVTTLSTIKKPKYRGQCCAGPAPPDLPKRIERALPVLGGFDSVASLKPKNRGELKQLARIWTPYAEHHE